MMKRRILGTFLAALLAAGAAFGQASHIQNGGHLPNPSSSSLGGVKSLAPAAHFWVTGINTDGSVPTARPACGDLSDAAASCNTDATNAANITTGTLPAARLPNPSSSTLGGIQSFAAQTARRA